MQFSNLDANDKRLPASVGGFTNGVSALEMAKGYATIKNDGGYRNPTCIIKITDADGQVLYQADQTASVVYKENACRQMTDMLQTVITSGTGRAIHLAICHAPVRRERPTITRMAGSSATRHTIRPVFGWAMTSQRSAGTGRRHLSGQDLGTPLCPLGCGGLEPIDFIASAGSDPDRSGTDEYNRKCLARDGRMTYNERHE